MSFTGYAFDIYPYNDPNGTRLVRLTPSKAVTLAFRLPEVGFGMADGQIVIHSAHADATAANFHKHNLVKVVDISTETKVGGFFLEEGDFAALSAAEAGGRLLTFRGPNTVYYLERAILREEPFSEVAEAGDTRGSFDVDGMWTWTNVFYGSVMTRAMEEGFYQPGPGGTSADAPLADATWDFGRVNDSDGTPWFSGVAVGEEFQVPWGTSILDLLLVVMRIDKNVHWRSGADLNYQAYTTDPAVDRTSTTFAADKVLFKAGENIVTEVSRDISASVERTAVLVTGTENTTAYVTGGTGDVTWIGHVDSSTVQGAVALAAVGETNLDAREIQVEAAFPLRHIVSDDELNGGYIPFIHYVPGDLVTLHTGTGDHDFNEFAIPVAAVRILHDQAGNWFGMPELGAQALSAESKAFEERVNRIIHQPGGHSHPPNPQLCDEAKSCSELTSTDLTVGTATNGDAEDTGGTQWSGGAYTTTHKHGDATSYFIASSDDGTIVYTFDAAQSFTAGTRYVLEFWAKSGAATTAVDVKFGVADGDEEVSPSLSDYDTETGADGSTWAVRRICWVPTANRTGVRVSIRITQASADYIAVDDLALYTAADDLAGTSNRAARCDHRHRAQDVSYSNAASGLDATNVQAAIDELADSSAGLTIEEEDGSPTGTFSTLTVPNHSLTDNGDGSASLAASLPHTGGLDDLDLHGSTGVGATETIDLTDGNWHLLTLDANCTLTLTGAVASKGCSIIVEVTQDATGGRTLTLPASVANKADLEAAQDTTASAVSFLILLTRDGGTTWYGFWAGGTASPLIVREVGGSDIDPVDEIEFDADDFVVSDQSGGVARIALAGGSSTPPDHFYRPLMDGAGNVITDGATGEAIMAFA